MAAKTKKRAKARARRKPSQVEVRWRVTRLREWREARKAHDPDNWTQQAVADKLAALNPPLDYTRESYQRVEKGDQMPPISLVEGLAKIYGTDTDTLLNFSPDEAEELNEFRRLRPEERRRALRAWRAATEA